MNVYKIIDEMF